MIIPYWTPTSEPAEEVARLERLALASWHNEGGAGLDRTSTPQVPMSQGQPSNQRNHSPAFRSCLHHAVVWTDQTHARILQFDANETIASSAYAREVPDAAPSYAHSLQQAFFADVCGQLSQVKQVLITGSTLSTSQLRQYIESHQSELNRQIAGFEVVDHPSDHQLIVFARAYFEARFNSEGLNLARKG